jgi:hypothetical protein
MSTTGGLLTIHKLNPHTVEAFKQVLLASGEGQEEASGGQRSAWHRWKHVLRRPLLHVVYHSVADTLMVSPRLLPALYIGMVDALAVVACLLRQDRYQPQRWYIEQSYVQASHAVAYAQLLYYVISHYAAQGSTSFVAYVEPQATVQISLLQQLGFHLVHRRLLFDVTERMGSLVSQYNHEPALALLPEGYRFVACTATHAETLALCYNHQLPDLWRQALLKQPAHFYPSLNPFTSARYDDRWQSDFSQHPQRWLLEQRHPATGEWQVVGFCELTVSPMATAESVPVQVTFYTLYDAPPEEQERLVEAMLLHCWQHAPKRPTQLKWCVWSYQQALVQACAKQSTIVNETVVYVKDYHCPVSKRLRSQLNLLRGVFRVSRPMPV